MRIKISLRRIFLCLRRYARVTKQKTMPRLNNKSEGRSVFPKIIPAAKDRSNQISIKLICN